MQPKFHPFFWLIIAGQVIVTAVFLMPVFMFYPGVTTGALTAMGVAIVIAAALIRFEWIGENGRWLGSNLGKIGAPFWGMGWATMTLFEPQVGWAIYIGGWGVLTLGLFLVGAADLRKRSPLGYAMIPMLVGWWPFVLEAATRAFLTQFEPLTQLQIMMLFTAGWVFQGVLLTHNKLPEALEAIIPTYSSTNV